MASVSKRSDVGDRPGGWLVRWREADGTQRKRSFKLKREADAFARNVELSQSTGAYVPPAAGKRSLADYWPTWERRQVHQTASSRNSLASLWNSRVEPRWGRVRLDQMRHGDIAEWVSELTEAGLSASRVRQAVYLLKGMLDGAVRDGLIARNPATGVDLPRLSKSTRHYLTHGEVHRLADEAGRVDPAYRLVVLVLAYCGLRWGEMAALRVADLDAGRGRLSVHRAVTEVAGRIVEGEPKDHERRSVPVPPFLVAELVVHAKGRDGADLLFASPEGSYLRNTNSRRRWWNRATAAAGLAGLVPHELRHTAASLAVHAGADVLMVSKMLGHASASMTLDRYGHLWDDGLDALAGRLHEAARPHLPGVDQGSAAI